MHKSLGGQFALVGSFTISFLGFLLSSFIFYHRVCSLPPLRISLLSLVEAHVNVMESIVVLPKFSPEPKFEPNFLRTGPKSSSKFNICAEPDLEFSSGFRSIEEVRTGFEPTLVQQSPSRFFLHFVKNILQFLPIKYFQQCQLCHCA